MARERSLDIARWGLISCWAKDIKIGFSTFNARAEEIDTKPAFREAFRQRRCLVPFDSFYEWKKTPIGKQPYAIGFKSGRLMAMAGLWETWRSPDGERVRSFTIATRPRMKPLIHLSQCRCKQLRTESQGKTIQGR